MRLSNRRLAATAAALAVAASGVAAFAGSQPSREFVDLGVRPSGVSLAPLPGGGFAAAYDDRLGANALFYAEKRGTGTWQPTEVAAAIGGKRVGREPELAISPNGMRVIAFRTDMQLDSATPASGELYVARSPNGSASSWWVQPLDAAAFGEAVAFDREGRPAIAYLARADTSDVAQIRLARPQPGGSWAITPLESTTFREAANGANATRLALAFDQTDRPWIAFVDAATRSLRLLTPGQPSERIATVPALADQAALAFGPDGAEAVAATGLAAESAGLFVTRWSGGRWRSTLAVRGVATAPIFLGFPRGAPRIAYRDDRGVNVLTLPTPQAGLARLQPQRLIAEAYSPTSSYTGALGAAVSRRTLGVAVVAPRGLLEFAAVSDGF